MGSLCWEMTASVTGRQENMGRKRKRKIRQVLQNLTLVVLLVWLVQQGRFCVPRHIEPPSGVQPIEVKMETTSYCHCGRCCSYKWFFFVPYQKHGAMDYRLKHIGVTSSGATVRPGTIAADTSIYPYGTIMYIPGYGYGRVEDTGGAIKGKHIDLYRPNHWYARQWGVRTKNVKVWLPPKKGKTWSFTPTVDGPSLLGNMLPVDTFDGDDEPESGSAVSIEAPDSPESTTNRSTLSETDEQIPLP
ncbi:MAG: 3D domain-containing protein [Pontiellaceae bacterium]|nr:3D domain-containing protein [Pontiellaceae bacterium]MBN2783252.1 3D domain-containing protein [Pontiellaceae bacterium]